MESSYKKDNLQHLKIAYNLCSSVLPSRGGITTTLIIKRTESTLGTS